MQSTKEVLVFLDAHCEAEFNWLPPLLAPIARNDRISTVPMIDGIDGNHYHFTTQGGGDRWGRATGFFLPILL
jgi:polypeptide N-acetylgalactosaminyltransferase